MCSQILTNVEHRLGHQSDLDESSGQKTAAILSVFAFCVYLVSWQICIILNIDKYYKFPTNNWHNKLHVAWKRKTSAASLPSRKQGSGIIIQFIPIRIDYYGLSVVSISSILIAYWRPISVVAAMATTPWLKSDDWEWGVPVFWAPLDPIKC